MSTPITPINDNTPIDEDLRQERLRQSATAIDQQLSAGGIVEVDPELAAFMGISEDDDFPEDDATEAHLFPYGRPEDDGEKGGEA